jgi:16S rRNA (adenine1518-N6/adenine1519-N6)-dimethyltransferase
MVPIAGPELARVDPKILADLVRRAFSARRKTLRNALGLQESDFKALALDPKLRPENLAPATYERISLHIAGTEHA